MADVCLLVILALASHIGPWLPKCQYDLEAHLGHIITCIYCILSSEINAYQKQIKMISITSEMI